MKPEVAIGCRRWVGFCFRGLVHQTLNLHPIPCPDFPCASRKRALPLTQISRCPPGGKSNSGAAGPQAAARVFTVAVALGPSYNYESNREDERYDCYRYHRYRYCRRCR